MNQIDQWLACIKQLQAEMVAVVTQFDPDDDCGSIVLEGVRRAADLLRGAVLELESGVKTSRSMAAWLDDLVGK